MTLPELVYGAPTNGPFERGRLDCIQDGNENNPFGSVGGESARPDLRKPAWVKADDWPRYREGYELQARARYGDSWRTCSFGWAHVLTIEPGGLPTEGSR